MTPARALAAALGRALAVPALGRALAVPALGRALAVPALGRALAVPALGRALAVPALRRVLAVPALGRALAVPALGRALAVPALGRALAVPALGRGAVSACVLTVAVLGPVPVRATTPVALVGPAGTHTLDDAALRALPRTDIEVVFWTRAGPERGDYSGTLLWRVVRDAVPPEGRLGRVVVVTGRDGYAAAFAVGELDPDYGGAPAILAFARDGADLPADRGPRLVVPGDKRGGRAVYDVVRIEVRDAAPPQHGGG